MRSILFSANPLPRQPMACRSFVHQPMRNFTPSNATPPTMIHIGSFTYQRINHFISRIFNGKWHVIRNSDIQWAGNPRYMPEDVLRKSLSIALTKPSPFEFPITRHLLQLSNTLPHDPNNLSQARHVALINQHLMNDYSPIPNANPLTVWSGQRIERWISLFDQYEQGIPTSLNGMYVADYNTASQYACKNSLLVKLEVPHSHFQPNAYGYNEIVSIVIDPAQFNFLHVAIGTSNTRAPSVIRDGAPFD